MGTVQSTAKKAPQKISRHVTGASPRVTLAFRAHETIRRHFFRSLARVSVLMTSDLAAFLVLRATMGISRDTAVTGTAVARVLNRAFPFGYLGGWRYAVALLIGLAITGNYGQGDKRRDSTRLMGGVLLATALSLWQNVWVMGVPRVAVQFAVTALAFWVTLRGIRRAIDWIVTSYRARTAQAERVLFIGDQNDSGARQVNARLLRDGMISVGWVPLRNGHPDSDGLASPEDIWHILQQRPADTVVLTSQLPEDILHSVVDASAAAGCRTLLVPRFNGASELRPGVAWHHGLPFLELSLPGLTVPHLLLKRFLDVVGASLLLVAASPLLLLIWAVIKVTSPGPALFAQDRVGLGGRLFRCLKFRTMREGADGEKESLAHLNHTGDPRLFKIPNDPRVTRIGRFLRRWSLDELPQLWNVLVGDMSLVGPRPFPETDLAGYQDHHFFRLSAKPGITGLWQVKGRSDIVDFEEVVRLDREYIERWSVGLDLAIMAQTFPAVFRRNGAY